MTTRSTLLVALGAVAALVSAWSEAVGDGWHGFASSATPPVAGLYRGTLSGLKIETLVVDTGHVYSLYGDEGIRGVVVARGAAGGSRFESTQARDFNLATGSAAPRAVRGDFSHTVLFNGTVSDIDGSQDFASSHTPQPTAATTLAAIEGTYRGAIGVAGVAGKEEAVLMVAEGAITGTSSTGCRFTGSVAPHATSDAFDVTLTYGDGCPRARSGASLAGHAYMADGTALYVIVTSQSLGDAALFVGMKP